MKQVMCHLNDVVFHCFPQKLKWQMWTNTKKLWTTAPAALRVISTNYSHHNGKLGQFPVHLTSFPPVSVAVLFFLCFFLYESIHHEHFKRLAFQFALNSLSLSHLSWFPCVWEQFNPHLSISIPDILSPVFPGCTAAFLCSSRWKVYFCADNISYIPCLLNAENWAIVWGTVRVLVAQSSGLQTDRVKPLHRGEG